MKVQDWCKLFFISFLNLAHCNRWSSIDLLFKCAEWMPMVLTEWIFHERSSFSDGSMFWPGGSQTRASLSSTDGRGDTTFLWLLKAIMSLEMKDFFCYLSEFNIIYSKHFRTSIFESYTFILIIPLKVGVSHLYQHSTAFVYIAYL